MSGNNRHYLVVAVILLLALGAVYKIEQAKGVKKFDIDLKKIPLAIGEWQGKEIKVTKDIIETLATEDVIIREYKDKEGTSVFLSIVYSQNNPDSIHPPELCYIGGGIELMSRSLDNVELEDGADFKLNKLAMRTPMGEFNAWYWFTAGDKMLSNYYLQQLYFLFNFLQNKKSSGALIRVSVEDASKTSENKAKSFIKEVMPVLRGIF